MAETVNALRTWDITMKTEGLDHRRVQTYLNRECSKWIFQREQGGGTEYDNYKCRITLKKKLKHSQIRTKLQTELERDDINISPTSEKCFGNDDEYYVMREEKRIDGPWRDEDKTVTPYWRNPKLRDWQQEIVDEIATYKPEMRTINLIVHRKGNQGKPFLTHYLGANGKIYQIPPLKDYKDMMQFLMSEYKDDRAVFIDIPRGLSNHANSQFFSAIETIKGGYLFDTRYKANSKYIDPPCLYIFCSHIILIVNTYLWTDGESGNWWTGN